MLQRHCNRLRPGHLRQPVGAALLILAGLLGSCQAGGPMGTVRLSELRAALPLPVRTAARATVSDLPLPRGIAIELTPRLWLIEVRTRRQWDRLRELSPAIGACPDLSRGPVFGLLLRSGRPLSGRWPVRIVSVRMVRGAALLEARADGGSFLLDTTGYLTLAQVPGARCAAVVDLGGQRFYPQAASD